MTNVWTRLVLVKNISHFIVQPFRLNISLRCEQHLESMKWRIVLYVILSYTVRFIICPNYKAAIWGKLRNSSTFVFCSIYQNITVCTWQSGTLLINLSVLTSPKNYWKQSSVDGFRIENVENCVISIIIQANRHYLHYDAVWSFLLVCKISQISHVT